MLNGGYVVLEDRSSQIGLIAGVAFALLMSKIDGLHKGENGQVTGRSICILPSPSAAQ